MAKVPARKIKTVFRLIKNGEILKIFITAGRRLKSAGRKLRHAISAAVFRLCGAKATGPSGGRLRILYVTNRLEAESGQTARYRIFNMIKCLKGKAFCTFETLEDGISGDDISIMKYDIIVLMRLNYSELTETLIKKARNYKIPVVFDVDDMIFMPEHAADFCAALGDASRENIGRYEKAFENFRQTLQNCDCATVSTVFLKDMMKKSRKKAYVIHNGYNAKQLKISEKYININKGENINIGYLSGTKTHDRDFAMAMPAIESLIKEDANIRLMITGCLESGRFPDDVARRTDFCPFMRWDRLIKRSARNYINLAPLDISNPFCQAKSELKFFEAALLKIPTVASRTDTFTRCITDGENGMLASDGTQWYNAIKKLAYDRDFYEKVACSAYTTATQRYSPEKIAAEALAVYRKIVSEYKLGMYK